MKLLVTFGPIYDVVHTKKKSWSWFVCAINSKPQKIGLLAPFVGSPEVEKSQKTKLLSKNPAIFIPESFSSRHFDA